MLGRLSPMQLQLECVHSILVGGPLQVHLLRARSNPDLAVRSLPNAHTLQIPQTVHSPKLKTSIRLTACVQRVSQPNPPFAPSDACSPSLAVDSPISQRNVPTKTTTMPSGMEARRMTSLTGMTQDRISPLLIHPCLATTWQGQALASNTRRCRPLAVVR